MKRALVIAVALCCALIATHGRAEQGDQEGGERGPLTLAVFGDWPYSLDLVAAACSAGRT